MINKYTNLRTSNYKLNVFNVAYQQTTRIVIQIRRMIAQNEKNVLGELANKTNNHTVSYKHRAEWILVQTK